MAWTYMFLVVIQLLYVIDPPGRSLGIDAFSGDDRPLHALPCFRLSHKSRRLKNNKTLHFGPADTALIRRNRIRSSRPAAA